MADAQGARAVTLPQQFQDEGWGGFKNGDLLQRAEAEFDLFITSDQNIRYHQNLAGRSIAILELSTKNIGRIQAASALIGGALDKIQPKEFTQLIIPWKIRAQNLTVSRASIEVDEAITIVRIRVALPLP